MNSDDGISDTSDTEQQRVSSELSMYMLQHEASIKSAPLLEHNSDDSSNDVSNDIVPEQVIYIGAAASLLLENSDSIPVMRTEDFLSHRLIGTIFDTVENLLTTKLQTNYLLVSLSSIVLTESGLEEISFCVCYDRATDGYILHSSPFNLIHIELLTIHLLSIQN